MTEPYYNHPGEVREAKNFQCCHCPKILSTPQGLCGHLLRLHKIKPQDIQHKQDWEVTGRVADDNVPMPTINRNVSTSSFSGDRRMKSKQEMTHNLECIVQGCGKVYSSSAGMTVHQRKAHGQGAKKDVNWHWTKKPTTINDLRSRAAQQRKGIGPADASVVEQPQPPKRKYVRRQPLVLTPDSKTIEINAVIRVPISIGQAEILQESELLT